MAGSFLPALRSVSCRRKRGTSSVEYGILLSLIGVVAIVVLAGSGNITHKILCDSTAAIAATVAPGVACPGSPLPVFRTGYLSPYGTPGVDYHIPLPVATTSDGSTITYTLVSSTKPNASIDPNTGAFTLLSPTAGIETIVANATSQGGTTQATFYSWVGQIGDPSPYGTVCNIEFGTCSVSGTQQATFYCPSQPLLKSSPMTVSSSFVCTIATFGVNSAGGCYKVCALQ